MPWSTREIAHLAHVTVNTVRHYHSIGLLDSPDRTANGYKRYTASHLVCLLRIRRLTELGVPLSSIDEVGSSSPAAHRELLEVDATLEADLSRLRRSRDDIAAILRNHAPVDTPRGFESVASRLSPGDRAVLHVVSRLADDETVATLRDSIARSSFIVAKEFAALRPDASELSRRSLADRLARGSDEWRSVDRLAPLLSRRRPSRSLIETRRILADTFLAFFNSAQRDVLARAACVDDEHTPSLGAEGGVTQTHERRHG